MGSNLGSEVAAEIAFLTSSAATQFSSGLMVPIHPLSLPSLWIDTKAPARFPNSSLYASEDLSISGHTSSGLTVTPSRICASRALLAIVT